MSHVSSKAAAQYVRMSTERQDFSISHQMAAIAVYAAEHGYRIVETYEDAGISGLTIEKRPGLRALIGDVVARAADFEVVLVYDVSRWGRFQNPDQAAHYEFICTEAGVRVEYCSEQFNNDGSISSTLLKGIKRAMAAEYSRELSAKVIHAQSRLAEQGYWQGGPAGYGYRRQQVRRDGSLGRLLEGGDIKGAQNGRTIIVSGPEFERAVVRRIFDLYVYKKLGFRAIASLLNSESIPAPYGETWSSSTTQSIITNERYIGTLVRRKEEKRLGSPARRLPETSWIRTRGALAPVVSNRLFGLAQARRRRSSRRFSDDEMLQRLKELLRCKGRLTRELIDRDRESPSSELYRRRFGSLEAVYGLVGYEPTGRQASGCHALSLRRDAIKRHPTDSLSDFDFLSALQTLLAEHGQLNAAVIEKGLGRWAYQAGRRRFGGGRRMYALAGYIPNQRQEMTFERSHSESITRDEAERLRLEATSHTRLTDKRLRATTQRELPLSDDVVGVRGRGPVGAALGRRERG